MRNNWKHSTSSESLVTWKSGKGKMGYAELFVFYERMGSNIVSHHSCGAHNIKLCFPKDLIQVGIENSERHTK